MFCWSIFFEICWRTKIYIVFQRNVSMKLLTPTYEDSQIWPNLCEHLLVESFTLRNRTQQYVLGQRRRRELNLLSLTVNWGPKSFHSICHPWNLACTYNRPIPVTQKLHQPVCQHRVGCQSPHSSKSLGYSAKIYCRCHTMGEEADLSPKVIYQGRRKHTSKWKKREKRWASFVSFSKMPSLHGDVHSDHFQVSLV